MNKKIGIITLFYKNYNYGGQLQALAMQKIFEDINYNIHSMSPQKNSFGKTYF